MFQARDGKLALEDMAGGTFTMWVQIPQSVMALLIFTVVCIALVPMEEYLDHYSAPQSSTFLNQRC
jgi:hypothetical protein